MLVDPRSPPHGGLHDDELEALGIDPASVLDVSVNVNPYGPSRSVLAAVRSAPLDRYPDPQGAATRRAMAKHLGVAAESILLGHGAVDLLWLVVRARLGPGKVLALVEPTFSEARAAAESVGANVVTWRASDADNFALDVRAVEALLRTRPDLFYVCAPANPTGAPLAAEVVASWASRFPTTWFVLDQAFLSLSDRFADADVPLPENVIALRSLTKDHALPGLRVGYLIASPDIVAALERRRPPWSVSAPALAAAEAAVADTGFVAESRARLLSDREQLCARLRASGFAVHPSSTIFVLVRAPGATALRRRLLARHRVLVRDATSFGLPDHVRICARPAGDVDRLMHALEQEVPPCLRAR